MKQGFSRSSINVFCLKLEWAQGVGIDIFRHLVSYPQQHWDFFHGGFEGVSWAQTLKFREGKFFSDGLYLQPSKYIHHTEQMCVCEQKTSSRNKNLLCWLLSLAIDKLSDLVLVCACADNPQKWPNLCRQCLLVQA